MCARHKYSTRTDSGKVYGALNSELRNELCCTEWIVNFQTPHTNSCLSEWLQWKCSRRQNKCFMQLILQGILSEMKSQGIHSSEWNQIENPSFYAKIEEFVFHAIRINFMENRNRNACFLWLILLDISFRFRLFVVRRPHYSSFQCVRSYNVLCGVSSCLSVWRQMTAPCCACKLSSLQNLDGFCVCVWWCPCV